MYARESYLLGLCQLNDTCGIQSWSHGHRWDQWENKVLRNFCKVLQWAYKTHETSRESSSIYVQK